MSGTLEGGRKAAATNKRLHGEDFYARIGKKGGKNGHTGGFAANPELARIAGKKGGKNGHTGGFAANPELARIAGKKGGQISRRGPAKKDGKEKAKKTETIETPEHGTQKNIHLWKRVFRKGEDA